VTVDPAAKADGKGRPTPKRKDAERRRKQRVKAPTSRKEASRLQREDAKRRRQEARAALNGGDQSKLPARDAGPVRGFARDFVDSRRNAGTLFLPAALLIFGLGASPNQAARTAGNGVLLLLVLLIVLDARRMSSRLLREVDHRFPDADTKGLRMYSVTRAMQIRRLRMPKPRVKVGDKI